MKSAIARVHAAGCTNLAGGWKCGADHVRKDHKQERVNRVLLLTDGQANVAMGDLPDAGWGAG